MNILPFEPIQLEHKCLINKYLSKYNYRNCDFSFANLYCWKDQYKTLITEIEDTLYIRFICTDGNPCYLFPLGGNLHTALEKMIKHAQNQSFSFRINAVTAQMRDDIEAVMPNVFRFSPERDFFEYIYLSSDLSKLAGKKHQQKRNHINQFKVKYPNHHIEAISAENLSLCADIYRQWATDIETRLPNIDLSNEHQSVRYAMQFYKELDLKGLVLFSEEVPIAFCFGAPLSADTFDVMVEKAVPNKVGAYTIINQAMASEIENHGYTYINREEDLGEENLRKAKESYHPCLLLERGSLFLKNPQ